VSLPDGNVAVVSPHLDDAILSLGAAIADSAARGTDVTVVTVLAGDPDGVEAATRWDRRAGFSTAAAAASRRRIEDAAACALVGARPVWLSWPYGENRRDIDEEQVWSDVSSALAEMDVVLLPGYPVSHPDHAWLVSLLLQRGVAARHTGFYVEQPYVPWRGRTEPRLPIAIADHVQRRVEWEPIRSSRLARRRKRSACRAYASQLPLLKGRALSPPLEWRITLGERRAGGELVGWLQA
jgi:LmbE family N-acetylglucosaminyl deacetylase